MGARSVGDLWWFNAPQVLTPEATKARKHPTTSISSPQPPVTLVEITPDEVMTCKALPSPGEPGVTPDAVNIPTNARPELRVRESRFVWLEDVSVPTIEPNRHDPLPPVRVKAGEASALLDFFDDSPHRQASPPEAR
ncbi:hypothetical protein [Candidatus Methylomirabilis sp.]|uniref:hypothetical protein n=1 Tax=Candidatus Methylomirabilis sp. TaxID=2032687 RepID=UPI002A65E1EA|nr:hypothetical protein [Candidatus Methylomirabilis sp.]